MEKSTLTILKGVIKKNATTEMDYYHFHNASKTENHTREPLSCSTVVNLGAYFKKIDTNILKGA